MRCPRLPLLLLALVALLAACANRDVVDAASDSAAEAWLVEDAAADDAEIGAMLEAGEADASSDRRGSDDGAVVTGSTGGQIPIELSDLGRDIIYTADLDLGANDVTAATTDAIRTIEGLGGFVFSQDTVGGSTGRSRIVFKILPEHFHAALDELGSVGSVRAQSINADDVSAVVVDLESRITTAAASVERLRNLLDAANDIERIASLENQLLQRETTLEQLRGQLRSVRGQVDLATITVTVTELLNRPSLGLAISSYEGHDGGFQCLDGGRTGAVAEGAALTVCYTLFNSGDTDLVDLRVDDPVLGAELNAMLVVEGSITGLAPGESLVVAHEIEAATSLRLRTSATASALDSEGATIDEPVAATAPRLRIDVIVDDSGLPGFGDVLSRSWQVLATVAVLIALAAVAVAPFALAALLIAPAVWMLIRRVRSTATSTDERAGDDDTQAAHDLPGDEANDPADIRGDVEGTTVSA